MLSSSRIVSLFFERGKDRSLRLVDLGRQISDSPSASARELILARWGGVLVFRSSLRLSSSAPWRS